MIRKYAAPAAALLFGATAAFLRKLELAGAYDDRGLPIAGKFITIALAAFVLAVFAAAVVLSLRMKTEIAEDCGFVSLFAGETPEIIPMVAFAAGAAVCGAVTAFSKAGGTTGEQIYGYGALAAGLAMLLSELMIFRKKNDRAAAAASAVAAVYFTYAMAFTYSRYASDPSIMAYGYKCAAPGFAALFFIYSAGFAFRRPAPKLTFVFGIMSVMILALTAPETQPLGEMLMRIFTALLIAGRLGRFIGSIHKN